MESDSSSLVGPKRQKTETIHNVAEFLKSCPETCFVFPYEWGFSRSSAMRGSESKPHDVVKQGDQAVHIHGYILHGRLWIPPNIVDRELMQSEGITRKKTKYQFMSKNPSKSWANYLPKIVHGKYSIPIVCLDRTHLHPSNHGKVVHLLRWNWIKAAHSYIEVEEMSIQQFSTTDSRLFTPKRPSHIQSIVGRLVAVGPLIRKAREKSFFFLEIYTEKSKFVKIMCQGSSYERIYPTMSCGDVLRIQNFEQLPWDHDLKCSILLLSDEFFPCAEAISITHASNLPLSGQTFSLSTRKSSDASPSHEHCHYHTILPPFLTNLIDESYLHTISYTGRITDIISPGVFEIDRAYFLITVHTPLWNYGLSLRTGATILVHNCHTFIDKYTAKGFVCCSRSKIDVIEFSPYVNEAVLTSHQTILFARYLPHVSAALYIWAINQYKQISVSKDQVRNQIIVSENMDICNVINLRTAFFSHGKCLINFSRPSLLTLKKFEDIPDMVDEKMLRLG